MKKFSDIDSRFRYVILAGLRAKQLLRGEKPKIKTKSKNLIRVAQEEVKRGLIEFELVAPKEEPVIEDVLVDEEIIEDDEDLMDIDSNEASDESEDENSEEVHKADDEDEESDDETDQESDEEPEEEDRD